MRDAMLRSFRIRSSRSPQTVDTHPVTEESSTFEEQCRQMLWGDDCERSFDIELLQKHARSARYESVDMKRYFYIKEVSQVRIYRHIKELRPNRRSISDSVPYETKFRVATCIPGSVDTILKMLATDNARDLYWMNLHTMKGRSSIELCEPSQRLEGSHATNEWVNKKYAYLQSSKYAQEPLEMCFAEYAFYDNQMQKASSQLPTESKMTMKGASNFITSSMTKNENRDSDNKKLNHTRSSIDLFSASTHSVNEPNMFGADVNPCTKGYIYKRSIDERHATVDKIRTAVTTSGDRRRGSIFYLRDFLYIIKSTRDRNICNVVLVATALIPKTKNASAESKASEFIDSCAQYLGFVRSILTKQWKEQIRSWGIQSKRSIFSASSRQSSSNNRSYHACAICLSSFSILRKRAQCAACKITVCSKCWVKKSSYDFKQSVLSPSRLAGTDDSHEDVAEVLDYKLSEATCKQSPDHSGLGRNRCSNTATYEICVACDKYGYWYERELDPRFSMSIQSLFSSTRKDALQLSRSIKPSGASISTNVSEPIPLLQSPTRTRMNRRSRTRTADEIVVMRQSMHSTNGPNVPFESVNSNRPSNTGIILLQEEDVVKLKAERFSRARSDDWGVRSRQLSFKEEDLANFTLVLS